MEEELVRDISNAIHKMVLREMEQIDNVTAKKPRTDNGYISNLKEAAQEILEIVRRHAENSHGH